ncbi:MAG: radical SAM protein [Candidatus Eisenbacteria sp.]|nr:radical SAM protein [Candidatus Eisenbacteria bacterium]
MRTCVRTARRLLRHAFRFLPGWVQLRVADRYLKHKLPRLGARRCPDALTLFVTSRCNARCAHCFYWRELNAGTNELRLDELERIAASLRDGLGSLALTGGEPVLRQELADIARIFNRMSTTRVIGIATNGLLPERTLETCQRILDECSLEKLSVQVSLDGMQGTHDAIRGVPGAFEKAMRTISLLAALQLKHPILTVSTALAIQPRNYGEIAELVDHLVPMGVSLKFLVIRGSRYGVFGLNPEISSDFDPKEDESASLSHDVEQLAALYVSLQELQARRPEAFWSELEQAKMHTTLRILTEQRRVLPCHAGRLEGVVYPDGSVAVCELTRPFADLREYDLDFERLWNSPAAAAMRAQTRSCACIHGCNLVTALQFHPAIASAAITGRSLSNRRQRWQWPVSGASRGEGA